MNRVISDSSKYDKEKQEWPQGGAGVQNEIGVVTEVWLWNQYFKKKKIGRK